MRPPEYLTLPKYISSTVKIEVGKNYTIYGQEMSGKSSLLRYLAFHLSQNYHCLWLHLNSSPDNTNKIYDTNSKLTVHNFRDYNFFYRFLTSLKEYKLILFADFGIVDIKIVDIVNQFPNVTLIMCSSKGKSIALTRNNCVLQRKQRLIHDDNTYGWYLNIQSLYGETLHFSTSKGILSQTFEELITQRAENNKSNTYIIEGKKVQGFEKALLQAEYGLV